MRDEIYNALKNHAPLTALVHDRIYYEVAPQSAKFPFVIFHKQSGVPKWAFSGRPLEWELWVAKAVTTGDSNAATEDIADAIEDALTDAVGLWCRRQSDIAYSEEETGEVYRHLGGLYRVAHERNP